MEETLRSLGLSPVEIKVYLTLTKLGTSLAGNIAKKAEVNRSNCYDAIERLIKKGLVCFVIKENRKYFQTTKTESLLTLIKDKEAKFKDELKNEEKAVKEAISKLKKIELEKEEQEASIYVGKKGIKSLLDDMLKERKEISVLGVAGEILSVLDYYLPRFHKDRVKAKIHLKIILGENLRKTRGKELKKLKYTIVGFLPEEFCSISTTNIYGDKVAIMLWSKNPFGILVNNKEIAESYRKQFKLLWNIVKKCKRKQFQNYKEN